MQKYDPDTFLKIIEQDAANMRRYQHGNAIAQAYNHTILPLGTYRDKVTQVYWGIADFFHHFKRQPRGMWLPETSVDNETLQVLHDHGIEFTILAPWQAETPEIDTGQPYLVSLSKQSEISVFFYQPELSARISFDPQVTINADDFARDLLLTHFKPEKQRRGEPQLLLLASDGELYGHHQSLRQHFLARLVDGASHNLDLHSTFPERWLRTYPPRAHVRIQENTSWSCHHGISRWMGNCLCTPGDSRWKGQLRLAFNRLASDLDQLYYETARAIFKDPWTLRNRYIHVLLGQMSIDALFAESADRSLTTSETRNIHLLLEAQRERQRMFTSCGWFFEDFDRIEPRNNVAYAAQAVRLAYLASGVDLESQTSADLQRVVSQYTALSADVIFRRHLRRAEGVQEVRLGYGG